MREEAQIDTDGSRKEGEGSKRTVRREEGDQRACKGSRRGGRSSPGKRAWSSVRRSGSVVGTQGAHRAEMRGAAKEARGREAKKRKDKAVGVTGEDSGATAQAEQPSESPYQVRRML